MPGIFGLYPYSKPDCRLYEKFFDFNNPNRINQQFTYKELVYGRSVLNKFDEDRFVFEDDTLIIVFEGICFNKSQKKIINSLSKGCLNSDLSCLITFKGIFSGFVFLKKRNELFLFTDPLSTKPIYFYQTENTFIFASELKVVSQFLSENDISFHENIDAWRCLLTFGYLLEDITPLKEVRKLRYGSFLKIDFTSFKSEVHHYFDFLRQPATLYKKEELIELFSEKITHAVKMEWDKDTEYNYNHFSFLSGGLDSRFNALLASSLNYKNIHTLTFSETGALDEKIASEIAEKNNFTHTFISLDNGNYLEKNLEEYISANDGLVVLHGAAHLQNALSLMELGEFGLGHSGQIGDVIFGSYHLDGSVNDNLTRACYNPDPEIIQKINIYQELMNNNFNNDSTELFLYKNRAINGILNGDRVASSSFDTASPFYDLELINLGLSIPKHLKRKSRLYREVLSKKFPYMCQYKWQQTGLPPKKGYQYELLSFMIKLKRYSQRRFGFHSDNMNPFDFWYSKNVHLQQNIKNIFDENLHYVDNNGLREDIIKTFNNEELSKKLCAISVLLSKKLHFGN